MKRWVAFLLALVLVAAAVCLFLSRTWMWADVPRVVAGTLNTGPVIKRFSLPAQLEATDGVYVVPDRNLSYSLIVEEVCVRVGEAVAAGQVLLRCASGKELMQALRAAEQTMERACLSALQARQGTEASYEAYLAWEMASNAVLQNPLDAALAAQEAAARAALEKACVMRMHRHGCPHVLQRSASSRRHKRSGWPCRLLRNGRGRSPRRRTDMW